jgi:hypothetical protein
VRRTGRVLPDPGFFGNDTGACGIAKVGNDVNEMSVQHNQDLGKYVTLYCDQFNNVVIRTSDTRRDHGQTRKCLSHNKMAASTRP